MVLAQEELLPLLEYIAIRHGYDFRLYAYSFLQRRVERILLLYSIDSISELIHKLEADIFFFKRFLAEVTVSVTEMFRDPGFWQLLRSQVFPVLQQLPEIRIWHAGCSTGEEVYSMAILLKEAGLLHKVKQLATDINPLSLEVAREGIYAHRKIEIYQQNYQATEGKSSLLEYFDAVGANFQIKNHLKHQVTFHQHNLVKGTPPGCFDLVICRNVLIYFDQELQTKVLRLLYDSLAPQQYLALGNYESLIWCEDYTRFDLLSDYYNVMRKAR